MNEQYTITGMTCGGCVDSVKKALEEVKGVVEASVQLDRPQATLVTDRSVRLRTLREKLQAIGNYRIEPQISYRAIGEDAPQKTLGTYKPLILIIAFITGISLLAQYPFAEFSGALWMRYFMAGFFIVFSFFKLLNIRGFVDAYAMYDIIAARWKGWGYMYPFVELVLGVMYLTNFSPIFTNAITVLVLGVSSIGVIKSNLDAKKIRCACLGDVFNLPMSTVTIVEDVAMTAMAGWSLIYLL